MFTRTKATAVAIALLLPSLPASAADGALSMDTVLGTTIADVTASLSAMGYEVRKTEMENGKMEVYFVGNDRMGEIYVSTSTGKPTKIEMK
jgi:hypothetical protein